MNNIKHKNTEIAIALKHNLNFCLFNDLRCDLAIHHTNLCIELTKLLVEDMSDQLKNELDIALSNELEGI